MKRGKHSFSKREQKRQQKYNNLKKLQDENLRKKLPGYLSKHPDDTEEVRFQVDKDGHHR